MKKLQIKICGIKSLNRIKWSRIWFDLSVLKGNRRLFVVKYKY